MKSSKTNAKVSLREQILIGFLGVSVLIAGYLMLRVKPLLKESEIQQEQLYFAERMERETKPVKVEAGSIDSLKIKLEKLKARVEQESSTLDGLQNSFIDLSQSDAEASMRNSITSLVDREGLRLLSIRASDHSLERVAQVKGRGSSEELARPLFDIQLSGRFSQLTSLVGDLKRLPYSVVITKLELETDNSRDDSRGPSNLLQILLTVAI